MRTHQGIKTERKNICWALLAWLCFGVGWGQSTFSLNSSNNIITQSGNGDLTGIESVSGVTTTTIAGKTYYELKDLRLIVEGTLTLNPENEQLIFTRTATGDVTNNVFIVRNNGVFNYGVSSTQNGREMYTSGIGLVFHYNGAATSSGFGADSFDTRNSGGLVVIDGGTFNAYGGTIKTDMPIGYGKALTTDDTGDVHGTIKRLTVTNVHSSKNRQFRLDLDTNGASQVTIEDLTLDGGMRFLVGNQAPTTPIGLTLEEATIKHATRQKDAVSFENLMLANNGASDDFNIGAASGENPDITSVNTDVGSAIRTNTGLGSGSIVNFKASKEVQFAITDDSGGGLESTVYVEGSQDNPTIVTTDANGELSTPEEITLMTIDKTNTDATETLTRYSLNETDADEFRFHLFSYGKRSTSIQENLKGTGVKTINWTLFVDNNISQTDKSIVDTYTEIETLDKLYDRAAAWKVDNVSVEYPTIQSPLITASGGTLDLDDRNLMIDANATQAFAVDTTTNTITIKASRLAVGNGTFSSIRTTGTISTANGATIDLGYEDTNGKNIFVDIDWGTDDPYDIEFTDLNDQTAISATGTTNLTQSYSGVIVAPNPFGSGIKIEVYDTGTTDSVTDRF